VVCRLGFGSRWVRVACGGLWAGSRWHFWVDFGQFGGGLRVCSLQTKKKKKMINKNIIPN
jgi:hypothetical protein